MSASTPGEPWTADDGTKWLHDSLGWTVWIPGEDGTWFLADDEFARLFPERQREPDAALGAYDMAPGQ